MASSESTASRLNWIDYAKGIGIILVVLGHVIKGLITVKLVDPTFAFYSVNFLYSFHMPLFFMLSGYFFLPSFLRRDNKSFMINKVKTILYPFVIWSLLQTSIEVLLSRYTNNHETPDVILTCLYQPRSIFWFLFALFFINLFLTVVYNISKKHAILISIIIWIIYINLPVTFGSFDKTFIHLLYFVVGIILYKNESLRQMILDKAYFFIISAVVFSISLYFFYSYPHDTWFNLLFPQLSGSFFVIYISQRLAKKSYLKFLEYLGVNSLIIYLQHLLTGNGVRIILHKVFHIDNTVIHIISGLLLGIIIPLIIYKIAKKTKWLSWLFEFPKGSQKNYIGSK